MTVARRSFLGLIAGTAASACVTQTFPHKGETKSMYGLIGKMRAVEGKREVLSAILLEGLRNMPGNLSYIVAADTEDKDVLWVTEVWTDAATHVASLKLPSVQEAITKGRPLIAGMERLAETRPIAGHGL